MDKLIVLGIVVLLVGVFFAFPYFMLCVANDFLGLSIAITLKTYLGAFLMCFMGAIIASPFKLAWEIVKNN